MAIYQFQTNIHCGSCIRAVKGFMDEVPKIQHWEVDTGHEQKILTVEGEELEPQAVIAAVEEAGFEIRPIV